MTIRENLRGISVQSGSIVGSSNKCADNIFVDVVLLDFEVTAQLPNITFPLERSFAGNLPVNRRDHPNNTLFFYGFEKSCGSLTAPADPNNKEPWGIWLNGGFAFCIIQWCECSCFIAVREGQVCLVCFSRYVRSLIIVLRVHLLPGLRTGPSKYKTIIPRSQTS